jgi:hypothetical protein
MSDRFPVKSAQCESRSGQVAAGWQVPQRSAQHTTNRPRHVHATFTQRVAQQRRNAPEALHAIGRAQSVFLDRPRPCSVQGRNLSEDSHRPWSGRIPERVTARLSSGLFGLVHDQPIGYLAERSRSRRPLHGCEGAAVFFSASALLDASSSCLHSGASPGRPLAS